MIDHWSVHSGERTGIPRMPPGLLDKPRAVLALAGLSLATLVLMPLQMLAVSFNWPMKRHIPMAFHRVALKMLGIRVHVHGAPDGRRPLLIVSNHISWMDIIIIGAQQPLCFVAKSEMAGWGIFGVFAKLQRTIFVERARRSKAGETSGAMASRMLEGDPVVLFPEGTTGDGNRVLAFKSALVGAAEALSAGEGTVVLQPLALAYTGYAGLPAGRLFRARLDWLGDYDLIEHIKALILLGNCDVDLFWGTPIVLDGRIDRKSATRLAERDVRRMVGLSNRGIVQNRMR